MFVSFTDCQSYSGGDISVTFSAGYVYAPICGDKHWVGLYIAYIQYSFNCITNSHYIIFANVNTASSSFYTIYVKGGLYQYLFVLCGHWGWMQKRSCVEPLKTNIGMLALVELVKNMPLNWYRFKIYFRYVNSNFWGGLIVYLWIQIKMLSVIIHK